MGLVTAVSNLVVAKRTRAANGSNATSSACRKAEDYKGAWAGYDKVKPIWWKSKHENEAVISCWGNELFKYNWTAWLKVQSVDLQKSLYGLNFKSLLAEDSWEWGWGYRWTLHSESARANWATKRKGANFRNETDVCRFCGGSKREVN